MGSDWTINSSLVCWAALDAQARVLRSSEGFTSLWGLGPQLFELEHWPELPGQFAFWQTADVERANALKRFIILPSPHDTEHYVALFTGYLGESDSAPALRQFGMQVNGFALLLWNFGEAPVAVAGDAWVLRCERVAELVSGDEAAQDMLSSLDTEKPVGWLTRDNAGKDWYHLNFLSIKLSAAEHYVALWATPLLSGVDRTVNEKVLQSRIDQQRSEIEILQNRVSRSVAEAERLQQQEQRGRIVNRQMQRQAQLGHWVWHLDTGEVYWSDEIYDLLGLTVNQLNRRFQSFIDVAHPDDRARVMAVVDRLLNAREEFDIEFRIERPDGLERMIHARGEIQITDNGSAQLVGSVGDITEKRNLETRAAAQAKQLEQANKMTALGTLVSGMAHEVNNPNSLVMMNARLLRQVWTDILPVTRAHADLHVNWRPGGLPYNELGGVVTDLIDDLEEASQRINKLVQDLRDYSRVTPAASVEAVSIGDVVDGALRLLAYPIRKFTHSLEVEPPEDDVSVLGDHRQLEQILVNLLLNALEALPNHDAGVRLKYYASGDRARIDIEDEGEGIDPVVSKELFDPFVSTKASSGGTGLGLSITRRLAERHGGQVTLEPLPGSGTRARVDLPLLSAADDHDE